MKRQKSHLIFLLSLSLAMFMTNCGGKKGTRTDTPTSGTATIACDECFAPIIQEEINVFTGLNISAHITPIFTGEAEIFKFLLEDSIRLIIAARDITDAENEYLKTLKRNPRSQKIATDGIALIINKENTDSLISFSTLQKIVTGEITDWQMISTNDKKTSRPINVVFDNKNSSTVRFINDSICKGKPMGTDLRAAESNPAVIEYVSRTPNALGIIGVNWISNLNDTNQLAFDNTIRVMSVSLSENPDEKNSYKPFPAFLATHQYPLVRDVYCIITDVRGGLPSGFVSFIAGDSGQRIILKAGLVPATRPTRLINTKNNF